MDQEYTVLEEKYKNLPFDVQEAISSSDVTVKIQAIAARHGLHIDQMEKLYEETGSVMLGITPAETFTARLSKELAIPPDKAQVITHDINEEVFLAIRESMKKIHADWEKIEEKPAEMAAPALAIDREALLKEIENPAPVKLPSMAPAGAPAVPPSPVVAAAPTPPPPGASPIAAAPVTPPELAAPPAPAVPSAPPEAPAESKPPFVPSEYKVFNAPPEQNAPPGMPSPIPPHLPQNLPIGKPDFAPPPVAQAPAATVVGQKLAAPAATQAVETVHKEGVISFAKKMDPYREAID